MPPIPPVGVTAGPKEKVLLGTMLVLPLPEPDDSIGPVTDPVGIVVMVGWTEIDDMLVTVTVAVGVGICVSVSILVGVALDAGAGGAATSCSCLFPKVDARFNESPE